MWRIVSKTINFVGGMKSPPETRSIAASRSFNTNGPVSLNFFCLSVIIQLSFSQSSRLSVSH